MGSERKDPIGESKLSKKTLLCNRVDHDAASSFPILSIWCVVCVKLASIVSGLLNAAEVPGSFDLEGSEPLYREDSSVVCGSKTRRLFLETGWMCCKDMLGCIGVGVLP